MQGHGSFRSVARTILPILLFVILFVGTSTFGLPSVTKQVTVGVMTERIRAGPTQTCEICSAAAAVQYRLIMDRLINGPSQTKLQKDPGDHQSTDPTLHSWQANEPSLLTRLPNIVRRQ